MIRMSSDAPHRLDVAIGHRIRERRRVIGVSQGQLARAVGVTFQQVQKYERGTNRVSFSRLMEIVRALGCELNDLTEGLESDQPTPVLGASQQLMAQDGASELLKAYAALDNKSLRQALLQHARALAGAAKAAADT
jgi:transcriptional regulator with XRE-family HTH domain